MNGKTNINPIIDCIDELNESDLKITLVMYGAGGWIEPKDLAVYTGLHYKTVKKSMKRPLVQNLIKQMDKKGDIDQELFKQLRVLSEILEKKKNGS